MSSISSLPYNPQFYVSGGSASITDVASGDGNLTFALAGTTLDISFAKTITVSGAVTDALTVSAFNNPWTANQPSESGSVLSSTTGGALSWIPPATVAGLKYITYVSGTTSSAWTGTGTTMISTTLTGLTPGKKLLIYFSFSCFTDNGTGSRMRVTADTGADLQTQEFLIVYALAQSSTPSCIFSFNSDPLGTSTQTLTIGFFAVGGYTVQFNDTATYSVAVLELA